MKLLVAGSRSIQNFDLSAYIPKDTELLIIGGAQGVDRLAERYADEHRISKLVLYPQYQRYSRAAPLRRNEEMIEFSDQVLVIWDGKSKGSKYTIEYAKKRHKDLVVVQVV